MRYATHQLVPIPQHFRTLDWDTTYEGLVRQLHAGESLAILLNTRGVRTAFRIDNARDLVEAHSTFVRSGSAESYSFIAFRG